MTWIGNLRAQLKVCRGLNDLEWQLKSTDIDRSEENLMTLTMMMAMMVMMMKGAF